MHQNLLNSTHQFVLRIIFLLMLLSLFACSVSKKEEYKLANVVNATKPKLSQQAALTLADKWWLEFNDETLNSLVEQGLENSPSLTASKSRLQSNQLNVNIANANLYPDLNLSVSANSDIEKLEKVDDSSIGFSSSWEIDLWGRIASLEEKAKWDYAAQRALHQIRTNTLAGNITIVWFNLLSENEKKRIYAGQHARTAQALDVIKRRFASGKNSITDIWQQARLLESIQARQTQNIAQTELLKKQLAFLIGSNELPELSLKPLPILSALPEMGISLEQLQQRPDIQQAYAELRAADENLATSVSNLFPRLTIRANYTTRKNDTSALFEDWAGNLVASIAQPLFDNKQRSNRVSQLELQLKATFADFEQTWLNAIYALEQRMINEERYYKAKEQLTRQRELAHKTEKVVSIKYLHGKSTYLQLLRAQETNLTLERQLFDASLTLINNRVALFRELSHGQFNQSPNFIDLTVKQ